MAYFLHYFAIPSFFSPYTLLSHPIPLFAFNSSKKSKKHKLPEKDGVQQNKLVESHTPSQIKKYFVVEAVVNVVVSKKQQQSSAYYYY